MTALVAMQSLALLGVKSSTVRTFRAPGADVVAIAVRNGEPLYATGPDVATALERLGNAAMFAMRTERAA